ncbi:MAG: 4Fe-4S binding protein [Desulfitobacteriaceae bacterium]
MNKPREKAVLFCWLVLISMFVLKLWFTLLWVVLFAMVMTYTQKKRSYCSNVCPVGYIQDRMYKPNNAGQKKVKNPSLWRKVFFVVFWTYLIVYIALLYNQTNLLWVKMLQLMFFSLSMALFLQYYFRKRFWCSYVCPVGSVLKGIVKLK